MLAICKPGEYLGSMQFLGERQTPLVIDSWDTTVCIYPRILSGEACFSFDLQEKIRIYVWSLDY